MYGYRLAVGTALALLITVLAAPAQTQPMSHEDTERAIDRIKANSDRFEEHFDDDIGDAAIDSSLRSDIKATVQRFEEASRHLEQRYSDESAAVPAVRVVLTEGARINAFLSQTPVTARIQNEWAVLRQDLDALAASYNLSDVWPGSLARAQYPVSGVPTMAPSGTAGDLVQDLQSNAYAFQSAVTGALAGSAPSDATGVAVINQYVGDLRVAVDRLKMAHASGQPTIESANEVLRRAEPVDQFMKNHPLSVSAQESWTRVRNDLIRLAAVHNLSPAWLSR